MSGMETNKLTIEWRTVVNCLLILYIITAVFHSILKYRACVTRARLMKNAHVLDNNKMTPGCINVEFKFTSTH